VEGLSGSSDPKGHIALLNKLRTNPEFNEYYINRMSDMWNTVFSCDNMLTRLDSIITLLSPEMTEHANRWSGTYQEWWDNAQDLRDFISLRCNNMATGMINCYNLTGPYNLTINTDPAGAGTVQLNTLTLNQFPWSGTYFGNINTNLTATANTNYSFTNWSANTQVFTPNSTSADVDLTLTSGDSIVAHFISTTSLPEMPGLDPSVSVSPTVFSQEAFVKIYLPENAAVSLKLFTVSGAEVLDLNTGGAELLAGLHTFSLRMPAQGAAAGVYLLDFRSDGYRKNVKLIYNPE
jgi:hypothetical protein